MAQGRPISASSSFDVAGTATTGAIARVASGAMPGGGAIPRRSPQPGRLSGPVVEGRRAASTRRRRRTVSIFLACRRSGVAPPAVASAGA